MASTASEYCSVYTPTSLGNGFWRLNPKPSHRGLQRPIYEGERVEDLRSQLNPKQLLKNVTYATDTPAYTEADRTIAGLPICSPIADLSGDRLGTTRHRLAGMHSTSKFEGTAGAPFCWHIEHCGTSSFNYLYKGEKEWHVIPPESKGKAESVFRRLPLSKAARRNCPQFMRHDAVFGTEGFAEHQIPMRTFRQFAGEIVLIFPDAYHSGHTVAYSVADARNYADGKWSISEADCCKSNCPIGSILWRHMRPRGGDDQIGEDEESAGEVDKNIALMDNRGRKKRPSEATPPKASKFRKTGHASDAVAGVLVQIRNADSFSSVPLFIEERPPSPEILLLACAIRSRLAIAQFREIVREWRSVPSSRVQDNESRCQLLGRLIDNAEKSSQFAEFRGRMGRAWLAAELDSSVPAGFAKVDSARRAEKRRELGWSEQKFEYQLSEGRKWNRLCGDKFKGLLAFLFATHRNAFHIAPRQFLDLGRYDTPASQVDEFHSLLECDYVRVLCQAGKAFELAIVDQDPNLEFKWETLPKSMDWTILPEPKLLSYMRPYAHITRNIYSPEEYPDWPRPQSWPQSWAWQANPLSEGASGCDVCQQQECQCLDYPPKPIPAIRQYGCRGLGLQAVGKAPGRVVYQKDETIGWILGKITPLISSTSDRCVDCVRPDIKEEPVVCHLECLDSGNLFRLLNHDCSPVAELKTRKISSQYVLTVVAKELIVDGMEITIRYSQKHYNPECLCGTCQDRIRLSEDRQS